MTAAAIAGKMRHRLPPASYMISFSTAMCGGA